MPARVQSAPTTEKAYWSQPTTELFAALASSNDGLTSREAASRLLRYGNNDAAAPKRAPAWLRFTRRFANPLILVLLLASALSAATGDVASFIIVVTIILLWCCSTLCRKTRPRAPLSDSLLVISCRPMVCC